MNKNRLRAGATWEEAGLLFPPVPGMSVLHCPICGLEVHRTLAYAPMQFPEVEAHKIEMFCRLHLAVFHPWRFWLWRLTSWDRVIRGLLS